MAILSATPAAAQDALSVQQEERSPFEPEAWTPGEPTWEAEGFGPLTLKTQSWFQSLRLSPVPYSPAPLPVGRIVMTESVTWSNLWGWQKDRYLIDAEVWRFNTHIRMGLTPWLQAGLQVSAFLSTGGFADGVIEEFHNAVRQTFPLLGTDGRPNFSRNKFRIHLTHPNGETFVMDGDQNLTAEDVVLFAQATVVQDRFSATTVAAGVQLKLPSGDMDDWIEGEGPDGGLYVTASKGIGNLVLYLSIAVGAYHPASFGGVRLATFGVTGIFALEWRAAADCSVVFGWMSSSGAADNYYEFSQPAHEASLGVKIRVTRSSLLEFAIIENFFNYRNSPDIGGHLGLSVLI